MEVRRWVSWCALTSSWTSRGIAPCSRSGAWFAGQSARLRINPTVACSSEKRWGIREHKGCVCYLALCLFVIKSVGPKQLDLGKRQLESCSFEAAFPSGKLRSPTPWKHSIFNVTLKRHWFSALKDISHYLFTLIKGQCEGGCNSLTTTGSP